VLVAAHFPQFSRSSLQGLFDKGLVIIDNEVAKAGERLKTGQQVLIDTSPLQIEPEPIDLPVVYEDKNVLVINKPAGVLTHSKGALNLEPTVASFLKTKITDVNLTGNRAGVVHRLDRGTSGLLIGAKNPEALQWLQKQFLARKTEKTYLAIVEGVPEPAAAVIDAPIGRDPRRPQRFKVTQAGKLAQTQYKVLKSFEKGDRTYSLIELKPVTGRTHQIRIHLAYIGHPVVGDYVYGRSENQPILLHAAELSLTLPNRQKQTFKVPPSPAFQDFMR